MITGIQLLLFCCPSYATSRIDSLKYTFCDSTQPDSVRRDAFSQMVNNFIHTEDDLDNAEKYLHYFIDTRKQLKDSIGIAYAHQNMGIILMKKEKFKEAKKYFLSFYSTIQKNGNKYDLVYAMNHLAFCYYKLGKINVAESYSKKAELLSKKIDLFSALAVSRVRLSEIYSDIKQTQKAIEYAELALEYGLQEGEMNIQMDAYQTLYKSYKQEEKIEKALAMKELNLLMADSILSKKKEMQALQQEAQYNYESKAIIDSLMTANETALKNIENERQKNDSQSKQVLTTIILVGIIISLALLFFLYKTNFSLVKSNRIIELQKEQIEDQQKKIKLKNTELNTQKVKLEKSVEQTKNALQEVIGSEKMTALGLRSAGIVFEINDPLNFIHGSTLGIQNYFETHLPDHDVKVENFILGLQTGIDRCSEIIKQLNLFNNTQEQNVEKYDIHQLIDHLIRKFENQIKINTTYSATSNVLLGNPDRLQIAFSNIISNAIEATLNDGEISIVTQSDSSFIHISFEDNGIGIHKSDTSKVTDPFYTTKEPEMRLGLGLSLAFSIVKEHNGLLEIESTVDKGTLITIQLPINKI